MPVTTHNLLGNVNLLLQRHDTFIDWTAQVDLGQIVAEIRLLLDEGDQPIFDL